jgi:hypothetical protein
VQESQGGSFTRMGHYEVRFGQGRDLHDADLLAAAQRSSVKCVPTEAEDFDPDEYPVGHVLAPRSQD